MDTDETLPGLRYAHFPLLAALGGCGSGSEFSFFYSESESEEFLLFCTFISIGFKQTDKPTLGGCFSLKWSPVLYPWCVFWTLGSHRLSERLPDCPEQQNNVPRLANSHSEICWCLFICRRRGALKFSGKAVIEQRTLCWSLLCGCGWGIVHI